MIYEWYGVSLRKLVNFGIVLPHDKQCNVIRQAVFFPR